MRIDAMTTQASAPGAQKPDDAARETGVATAQPGAQRNETSPETTENVKEMAAAAQQIESYLRSVGRTVEFRIDEHTNKTVVTVRDAHGELIRQIPGDELLWLARHLKEGLGGLINVRV